MRDLNSREYWNLMMMGHTIDDNTKHSIQREYERDSVSGNRHSTQNNTSEGTTKEKKEE